MVQCAPDVDSFRRRLVCTRFCIISVKLVHCEKVKDVDNTAAVQHVGCSSGD